MLKIILGNSRNGKVQEMGPYPHVTLTYNLLRAGDKNGDAEAIGRINMSDEWIVDGKLWTDVTIWPVEDDDG